jgi:hypothetical protein
MIRFAAMLCGLALAGCSAAPARDLQSVDPGTEVTLAPGASVSLKSGELKVRFVAVTEDSRCPRDVNCIWAGEVKVRLETRHSTNTATPVEVRAGDSTDSGGYRLTVVRVEPQPVSTTRIAPQDYRVTLTIAKTG